MFDVLFICSYVLGFFANPIYGLLFLILCFLIASWDMILMNATFLALVFVIIYVGAIAVLFLFVIMMLNIKKDGDELSSTKERNSTFWREVFNDFIDYFALSFVFSFLAGNLYELIEFEFNTEDTEEDIEEQDQKNSILINVIDTITDLEVPFFFLDIDTLSEIDIFGQLLFNYFLFCFLISGLILLVAMIGAIILTFDFRSSSMQKKEYIFKQLSRSNTCLSYLY